MTPELPPGTMDSLPYGVVVVATDRAIVGANASALALLPDLASTRPARCNDVLLCDRQGEPCQHGCLAARATAAGEALPEVRIDVADAPSGALWVTAAPLADPPCAILHLRPGQVNDRRRRSEPHWLSGPELRISVLGRTLIESGCSDLGGQWLDERSGQVLKYLTCNRDRRVAADEIAEAIWPDAGVGAVGSTRHAIYRLRDKLEPGRTQHGSSSFVMAVGGGYALDVRNIWIDATEFEAAVDAGLSAMGELDMASATRQLAYAMELYVGELLADEPYVEWAHDERARLHRMAVGALRALAALANERDDPGSSVIHLERLCALEPYDDGAHRELVTALYAEGRRSDARRRYVDFARRIRHEFNETPSFELKSLGGSRVPDGPSR